MDLHALDVSLSRRRVLQSLGALVVVVPSAEPWAARSLAQGAVASIPAPRVGLGPAELDAWIAIDKAGRVTAYFGKPDVGLGVDAAICQIVAEELDVPYEHVDLVMADTALTFNQGGVSGSTGIQRGAIPLRHAAAEARAVLLARASARLGVAQDRLRVDAGVVTVADEPSRRLRYGELVDEPFNHKLEWNGQYGNGLVASGKARPKSPDQYKVVGTSVQRREVPLKVFGRFQYVADLKRPNMLYGRAIRPPVAGAVPVSVSDASIAHIRGAKVVRKADFIGVVANNEWDAVRASRALKVSWSDAAGPFVPNDRIHDHIRATAPAKRQIEKASGNVDAAFAGAGKIVSAQYEWPFQSHACLAPACAVAEVTKDGVTVWHSSQKPHSASEGIARMLGMPTEKVRSISMTGPGSYGRNDAGDAAADAVLMAVLTGRPVRVQGARSDGHGWDPKGPASIHMARAVIGRQGTIEAYQFMSKGFSRLEVATAESGPHDMLAGMLIGFDNPPVHTFGVPEEAYVIPNRQMGWETIPTQLVKASPLRTSHIRDPVGPQLHFASESFIDECALAAEADPVEFRLRHLTNPRHVAVVKAAAQKAEWKPGPPGSRRGVRGGLQTGRGFAYTLRGETVVAIVADVEVDAATGRVWPRRFVVAHECGLIVNPQGLTLCIEAGVVQSTSRALFEEVTFDSRNVTSVDWAGYPILDIRDAPEAIDVVLLNRPDLPPYGAGEPCARTVPAAIANAIFDATGVRMRRVPLSPANVKAALAQAAAQRV